MKSTAFLILSISLFSFHSVQAESTDSAQDPSIFNLFASDKEESALFPLPESMILDEQEQLIEIATEADFSSQDVAQEFEQVDLNTMDEEIPLASAEEFEKTQAEHEDLVASNASLLDTTAAIVPDIEFKKDTLPSLKIDLKQVFAGSPIIYSILLFLSIASLFIWLYSLFTLGESCKPSEKVMKELRAKIGGRSYEEALALCTKHDSSFCKMLASLITSRKYGLQMMLENMKVEGKRATIANWQRLGLLNDIAIVAPMLGLLGTVLGMFYAFYDLNRSMESISTLFDGLGISVGTTVAGLIVALLAMVFHSIAKHRLIRTLAIVENEAHAIATVIDQNSST